MIGEAIETTNASSQVNYKDCRSRIKDLLLNVNSAEGIYNLFKFLNYPEDCLNDVSYKRKIDNFGFKKDHEDNIKNIYTVLNFGKDLYVFLIEAETDSPSFIRYMVKFFSDKYSKTLLIFTTDYESFVFVFPHLQKADAGKLKLQITKLYIEKDMIYRTDIETLSYLFWNGEDTWRDVWKKWKYAFSIEKVSKEFFEKYKHLFGNLRDSLQEVMDKDLVVKEEFIRIVGGDKEELEKYVVEFSKKLLSQVVFIYFMQKKGWLGVKKNDSGRFMDWGTGPKDFMRRLFNKEYVGYNNFFNDILEPLFYDTFAINREDKEDYSDELNCKIPFLNGVLFEPIGGYDWKNMNIYLENSLFKEIIDTFDRFNFTVREDEPLEKEVAVDPEMLGKVFENLLEVKDRKSKGVFFTPREIVHYMCQQSLINYLETNTTIKREDIEEFIKIGDENIDGVDFRNVIPKSIEANYRIIDGLLREIKIVDPAVGSGAFLVGMMNEIVKTRSLLSIYFSEDMEVYDLKRECIENSLYGVDILSSAVEICQLRLWLSLVVEEIDINKIKPLPNLDYKIECGNSLLEEFDGVKLFDESLLGEKIRDIGPELNRLKKEFFNEYDRDKKEELGGEIEELQRGLIEVTLKEQGNEEVLEKLDTIMRCKSKPFFLWKLYFTEVFQRESPGFDVVIANPPYMSAWSMKKDDPSIRSKIKNSLGTYNILKGHWDSYIAFVAQGHNILRNAGSLAYIVPNPILREKYATETRKFLLKDMTLQSILEFNDINVFEGVARRTSVLISQKRKSNSYSIGIYSNKDDLIQQINTVEVSLWLRLQSVHFLLKGNIQEDELISKLELKSDRIGNFFYVNYGAQVCSKKKGKFKKNMVVTKNPIGNAKKFYEGKDLHRWHIKSRVLWLDYRQQELYGPRSPELFENDKIVIRHISDKHHRIAASIDKSNRYCDHGIIIITPYDAVNNSGLRLDFKGYNKLGNSIDLRYALAILLSNLITFHFRKRFATESLQGFTSHIYPMSVRGLIMKEISSEHQKPFIQLVDQILSITKDDDYLDNPDKQAKVRGLEKEIDKLVYKLYGLTAEEIEIVEGFNDK